VGVTYFCVASSTLKIHLNIKQGKSYLFPTAKVIDKMHVSKVGCILSLEHVLLFIFSNVIWTDRNFTHRPYYFLHEAILKNETWKIG
jgi:hypothetical protein